MKLKQIKIQEILLKQNYITEEDLNLALRSSKPGELVNQLIESKVLSKELLGQAVAEYFEIKFVDLEKRPVDPLLMIKLPLDFCFENLTILIEETEENIKIATADPTKLTEFTAIISEFFPAKKIDYHYALDRDIESALVNVKQPLQERFDEIIDKNYYSAPDIFDEIIVEAFENKASDIHFEPQNANKVLLRFRVDGMLREIATIPKSIFEKVLNRIKVLARMQIDEHYAPQDGSIRINSKTFDLDLRVSIIPTIEGEKVVIRVLSDYIRDLNITDLGFDEISEKLLRDVLKKRYGMVLTTGPTGSGKSTTLYAVLRMIKSPTLNITTIEDPVEYRIPGINQIQVDHSHDISFARGLRSIVRQDPNVILVGEIRDNETAEIAVNAALTGHLLLSTFHANDAATAIPRLIDMGIEPFLLSSTINLIIAQRLARRICPNCRYSEEYNEQELKDVLGVEPKKFFRDKITRLYKGKGCEKCGYTGYKGRVAILELIYVTDEIKELIQKSPSSQEIWNLAREQGARSFFEEGLGKVKLGITTLEELVRVAPISFNQIKAYGKTETAKTKK